MKTLLYPLAVVLALTVASTASAAVFVNVGPVHVAVGGRPNHHPHPWVGNHPIPGPVFGPGAWAPVGGGSVGVIAPRERREIREEARELRQDIRQAGPFVSPRERREIRDDVRDLRREYREALNH